VLEKSKHAVTKKGGKTKAGQTDRRGRGGKGQRAYRLRGKPQGGVKTRNKNKGKGRTKRGGKPSRHPCSLSHLRWWVERGTLQYNQLHLGRNKSSWEGNLMSPEKLESFGKDGPVKGKKKSRLQFSHRLTHGKFERIKSGDLVPPHKRRGRQHC